MGGFFIMKKLNDGKMKKVITRIYRQRNIRDKQHKKIV